MTAGKMKMDEDRGQQAVSSKEERKAKQGRKQSAKAANEKTSLLEKTVRNTESIQE